MRTRSSGPAKDPATGQIIPDAPQSTIPAFIHPPVPFNPYPEAAFPTLEFPVPQYLGQNEQPRVGHSSQNCQATPDRSSSRSELTRHQHRAQEEARHLTEAVHDTKLHLEKNASTAGEMFIPRNQPEQQKWITPDDLGEYPFNPYETEDNELNDNDGNMHPEASTTPQVR